MPTKPRKRKEQGLVHYDVRLTDWRWDYSFSVAAPLGLEPLRKPFFDDRQMELYGVPIRADGLKADAAKIRLLFLVDMKGLGDVSPPPTIGDIYLHDRLLEALVIMPTDVLSSVLVMLTTNQFKRVSIWAPKLRYGRSQVEGFHFYRAIDDNESLSVS